MHRYFYKVEVKNLLFIMFLRLADGIEIQCGKIFGFGPNADEPTATFKISTATDEEMEKLNLTATHNLGDERSVRQHRLRVRNQG